MTRKVSLSEHVRRRNGVPLGAPGSLSKMLYRSFGAKSFAAFWQYWNPIWGYYLNRNIFQPSKKRLNVSMALLLTFSISGLLHDIAVMLIKMKPVFFFTPWFFLMGLLILFTKRINYNLSGLPWLGRAICHLSMIVASLMLVISVERFMI